LVFGVILAVLAAAANAASNVLQRKANREQPPELSMSPRLLVELARRPVWLAGIVLVVASFLLMAAALDMGRLSAIQPILVLELPMTLLAGSFVFGSPLRSREWLSAGAMTLGLAGLIAFLAPAGGSHGRASGAMWLVSSALTLGAVLGCVLLSYTGGPGRRPAMLGVAAGIAFGLTAAYMKGMTASFHDGIAGIVTTWQTYAVAVAGVGAMFLMQNALHAGRLLAAQPGLTLADPGVAMVWGMLVFKETVRGGAWLAPSVVSGLLLAAGAIALARSPLLEGVAATGEDDGREKAGIDSAGRQGKRDRGENRPPKAHPVGQAG
jgi:drug/metabolite transporter (DMT)-like permease